MKTDEVTIIKGALDLHNKSVADAMTPMDKVYMLDIDRELDIMTMAEIMVCIHISYLIHVIKKNFFLINVFD